jgi:hypothetical protein
MPRERHALDRRCKSIDGCFLRTAVMQPKRHLNSSMSDKITALHIHCAIFMNEKKVEDPKLVIVYFANGTVQWVKSGSTNQWSRDGGRVNKFFESRVYHNHKGEKVKIKQHFKLLNTVFMDVGSGAFLDTTREDLLGLLPDPNDPIQHCKWWDVDWSCPIVFEPKPERKPLKSPVIKN